MREESGTVIVSVSILAEVGEHTVSAFLDDCSRCCFNSSLRRLKFCRAVSYSLASDAAGFNVLEVFSETVDSTKSGVTVVWIEDSTVVGMTVALAERSEAGVVLIVGLDE